VRHWLIGSSVLVALALAERAEADERPMPLKAPANVAKSSSDKPYDWSGFYLGGHFGGAFGRSDWSSAGGTPLAGSFDLTQGFNAFKGTGSYFVGLQAGYNVVLPSRIVVGAEANVSFPSTIEGSQAFSSASAGTASFAEQVQFFGSVRGRLGYAPGDWLIYATGGFAFSYDEFTRTQLTGTPVGGTAVPGTVESRFIVPRAGWTAGAGVEVALAPHWSARLEYLYTQFNTRSVVFPAGAQTFTSDLSLQSVRLGLNYQIGEKAISDFKGITAPDAESWAFHAQTTYLHQFTPGFRSPYIGPHSLLPNQGRETWDVTFYAGLKLWSGAEFWVNPEIEQGFGLSNTLGVAGFPSGEAYKLGSSVPYARVQRIFVRQTIDLGGKSESIDADINRFAGKQTADRVVITAGKFNIADVFDTNRYAHDPRNDFMNWALIDTGSFDFAGDAWGYNYGAAVEWYQGDWTVRGGFFDVSIVPGSTDLDPTFRQHQWLAEIEHRHELWGQPGKIALTGFLTRGDFGRYSDAVLLAQIVGGPAEISAVRRFTTRTGISLNVEQQLAPDLGLFMRAGIADGNIEATAFTDIDQTLAGGLSLKGNRWGRPDDTVGIAGALNGISDSHRAFLNAGGLGLLVGDGKLPNYSPEQIIETYYSFPVSMWRMTFDYQFIANPGYNRDRGPASVFGMRMRTQF
jgi:high affinity Mn2+ porin